MNGQRILVKNTASAANGRGHKVILKRAGSSSSSLRLVELDQRTRPARRERRLIAALERDLGRSPTTLESVLFRSAARLDTLSALASSEVGRSGLASSGAADSLIRAARELLALVESDKLIHVVRPDMSAVVAAQREILRGMETESLRAIYGHFYATAQAEPTPAPPPPAAASAAPLLALPRPVLPRRPVRQPDPAPQSQPPEPGGPGFVIRKPKNYEVIADAPLENETQRWGSPWSM